jgi:nicotinamidase-related amidase
VNRFGSLLLAASLLEGASLEVTLRSRVEPFKGSGEWQEVQIKRTLPVRQTAILICDMWDKHWCAGATRRVDALAPKMASLVDRARARGVQIIHAPSDVMDYYRDDPHRRAILAVAPVPPPPELALSDPHLPIDDANGGCDTGDPSYNAWTREHPALRIAGDDVISDNGREIYSLLREKGIRNLLVMGVHTNMCILNRSFAIKQMTKWGIRCVLVRDLTDAMYDPRDLPFVTHDRGTELVVEHIEKYWCPSVLSSSLRAALARIR